MCVVGCICGWGGIGWGNWWNLVLWSVGYVCSLVLCCWSVGCIGGWFFCWFGWCNGLGWCWVYGIWIGIVFGYWGVGVVLFVLWWICIGWCWVGIGW